MEPAVASVLVVDDEPSMRDVLEVGLRQHGFNVRLAPDAAAALDALERQRIDVILLDVMLPRIDGLTLVPMLRRLTEIPIVMLSAKASVADRIAALDAGADDYVVKPFDFGELSARLRCALRRPALGEVVQIGYADLSIDLAAHRVERGGEEIALSAREFALLAVLARSPQRVRLRGLRRGRQQGRRVDSEAHDRESPVVGGRVAARPSSRAHHSFRPHIFKEAGTTRSWYAAANRSLRAPSPGQA